MPHAVGAATRNVPRPRTSCRRPESYSPAARAAPLKDPIEQIAREDDDDGGRAEEYSDQLPGHDLLEQGGLGERESYDRHHECECGSQRYALGDEYLHHRHDACGVGVHRYGQQHRQRHGIRVVVSHPSCEEFVGHVTVDSRTDGDADHDVEEYAPDDVAGVAQDGREPYGERQPLGLPAGALRLGLRLYLPYPGSEQLFEAHFPEKPSAEHAHRDAGGDVQDRDAPSEGAGEHGDRDFVD